MAAIGKQGWSPVGRAVGEPLVEGLVRQVADTIEQLSARRSELSDGDGWMNVEAALSNLHGAMIALQLLDQGSVKPVA